VRSWQKKAHDAIEALALVEGAISKQDLCIAASTAENSTLLRDYESSCHELSLHFQIESCT
jgi:hypothetical protein